MPDEQHSLTTYVSDMLALERHVRIPFGKQADDEDFTQYADARTLVQELRSITDSHIEALETCLQQLGGHEASPVKSAVATVEGFFAGAIDMVRKTKVSKSLRDDYTALALCAAGYEMLQTTAIALGSTDVSRIAEQHLRDYASCIMRIGRSLPSVVLQELQDIGLSVDPTMAETARRCAEQAWQAGAQAYHGTETGTIESGVRTGTATPPLR